MGKKLLMAFFMTAFAPSQADSQESAVPLPELTVEVSRDWCPVSDDPAAHEALESAAMGITDPSSYEGLSVQTQGVVRSVRVNEVGRTPVPPQTIRSRFSMKSAIKSDSARVIGMRPISMDESSWTKDPLLRLIGRT